MREFSKDGTSKYRLKNNMLINNLVLSTMYGICKPSFISEKERPLLDNYKGQSL